MVSGAIASLAGGAAGGAAARAVGGTISIAARLLTGGVKRGRRQISRDLQRTRDETDRTRARFQQLDEQTKSLTNNLTAVGAAGSAGITAMVQDAPALADEFARMRNTSRQLGFTLGRAVEPVFTKLANDTLPRLLDFVERNEETFKSLAEDMSTVIDLGGDAAEFTAKTAKLQGGFTPLPSALQGNSDATFDDDATGQILQGAQRSFFMGAPGLSIAIQAGISGAQAMTERDIFRNQSIKGSNASGTQ